MTKETSLSESGEPSDDMPIWRYMDMARLVVLLSHKRMWFPKAATLLDDPYEGFGIAQGLTSPLLAGVHQIAAEDGMAMFFAHASFLATQEILEAPDRLFVNSWCMGPESMGMWKLYGEQGRGVALKSTIGRFKRALSLSLGPDQYRFGKVRYHESLESAANVTHDFRLSSVPMSGDLWKLVLQLAFNKRDSYEHEREWRAAIYQEHRPDVSGVDVPVDLNVLVAEVYVGPKAGDVEALAVRAMLANAGLGLEPLRSALLSRP